MIIDFGGTMQDCKVNILGTEYKIEKHNPTADKDLKPSNKMGYCFYDEKLIVYSDLSIDEEWGKESEEARESREKITIRHEIFHAFLYESGIAQNSCEVDAWAQNEEMIDWFAIQSPKIFKVFQELDIL